jgi:hypothetical protein
MKKTPTKTDSVAPPDGVELVVERVQTGVRLEKRLLKVLKGLAEYHDMTLGDLLEGIVLHAFAGQPPFSEETMRHVADLKRIYGLDLDASASHRLVEKNAARAASAAAPRKRHKR